MTSNDQAAIQSVSSTKQDWVKPEIVSFAAAVDAQGNQQPVTTDGSSGTNFS